MADHNLPVLTSTYTDFLNLLDARLDDLALGLATDTTSGATNLPTGSIRWDATSKYWTRNGTALSTAYNININGTIGATTPAAGSFTTLSTSGIASLAASSTVGTIAIADISSSQTFTNKTLTSPVINGFSGDTSIVSLGTTHFYKDASGNIGLGTANPQTQFHVLSSTGPELRVQSISTSAASLSLQDSASTFPLVLKSAGPDLTFTTGNAERLRLTASGRLVLGNGETNANPTSSVELRTTSGNGTNIAGTTLNISGGQSTGSANGGLINFYTTPAGVSGSALNNYNLRMTILSNGNVGIGVVTPSSKLQVNGDITATSYNGGPLAGFRNRVINGNGLVTQRGVAPTLTSTLQYGLCDRVLVGVLGGTSVGGSVNSFILSGSSNNLWWGITGASWTNGTPQFVHRIEAYNVSDMSGKTVTFSGKLYQTSGSTRTFNIYIQKPSSYNQFSSVLTLIASTTVSVPSSSVTQFSFTFPLGATDAENGIQLQVVDSLANTVAGKTYVTSDWQFELGSVATNFEVRPYSVELNLCQRYFQKLVVGFVGYAAASSGAGGAITFPTRLRAIPTIGFLYDGAYTNVPGGAVTAAAVDEFSLYYYKVATVTGNTAYYTAISASAEL